MVQLNEIHPYRARKTFLELFERYSIEIPSFINNLLSIKAHILRYLRGDEQKAISVFNILPFDIEKKGQSTTCFSTAKVVAKANGWLNDYLELNEI